MELSWKSEEFQFWHRSYSLKYHFQSSSSKPCCKNPSPAVCCAGGCTAFDMFDSAVERVPGYRSLPQCRVHECTPVNRHSENSKPKPHTPYTSTIWLQQQMLTGSRSAGRHVSRSAGLRHQEHRLGLRCGGGCGDLWSTSRKTKGNETRCMETHQLMAIFSLQNLALLRTLR